MIYNHWRDFAVGRQQLRSARQRLVLTNGCFDLLHPGHLALLEEARTLGDFLLVAINADSSIRSSKGPQRPVIPEMERAELLSSMASVDGVVIFPEPTPIAMISTLLPEVLVKGADWGPGQVVGEPEVLAAGGRVIRVRLQTGYSTSGTIARARTLPGSAIGR
ncbi:MAG: adenylyltransferase/cytidyltransferase family protein [Terriglobales bacterium]